MVEKRYEGEWRRMPGKTQDFGVARFATMRPVRRCVSFKWLVTLRWRVLRCHGFIRLAEVVQVMAPERREQRRIGAISLDDSSLKSETGKATRFPNKAVKKLVLSRPAFVVGGSAICGCLRRLPRDEDHGVACTSEWCCG